MREAEFQKYLKSIWNEDLDNVNPTVEHAILGIASEGGELLDNLKKAKCYHIGIDVKNLKEELGDVLHYMMQMMRLYDWTLEDIMQSNYDKLSVRYPNGYSHRDAIERKDK